jgi:glycosyltransferase involved in cell wall biosynthesis
MIVVEPCAYKVGTNVYAKRLCDALGSKQKLTRSILDVVQPTSKIWFILRFIILYLRVWRLQRLHDCAVFFLSVEPTAFPILFYFLPFRQKCFVKVGGYEFRISDTVGLKNWLIKLRVLCWRLIPNTIKITETKHVEERLKLIGIKNVVNLFHPVDGEIGETSTGMNLEKPKILYFGHRPINDKNTQLILDLAKFQLDYQIYIAGYEEDLTIDTIITDYIETHDLENITYKNQQVSELEKFNLFKACDVVVLPYKKAYDGGSGVFFDAVKFGCKVVASNVGEFPTLLSDEVLGATFTADDLGSLVEALKKIGEKDVRNELYENSRSQIFQNRSFDKFAAKILELTG